MTRALRADDLYALRVPSDPQLAPDGSRVAFVVTQADRDSDEHHTSIWICPTDGGEPERFTHGKADATPRWSPNGALLAFHRKDDSDKTQVWVISSSGGEARKLSSAPLGAAEFEWAPDGDSIAFTAVMPRSGEPDEFEEAAKKAPMVITELPVKVDGDGIDRGLRPHLFVIGLGEGAEARRLTEGDFGVQSPAWSPDGKQIAFVSARHPERGLDLASHLFVIDTDGGDLRQITHGSGIVQAPAWTPNGRRLVFVGQSEVRLDRFTRLFVIDAAGGTATDLTAGLDRNVMVGAAAYPGAPPRPTADGIGAYFCIRDGGCIHLYRIPLEGGTPTPVITGDERVISGVTSGSLLAYVISTTDSPGEVFVCAPDGSQERRLTELNVEPLADLEFVIPQALSFTAPDGTAIEGWLLHGGDDTPAPLLLDIHGGPHNAWGPAFTTWNLYPQVLAGLGWAVLQINPRGSDGYGEDFMRMVSAGWGKKDMDDFMSAVDAAIESGVADPERLAVTGYSYGGYMTNWIVTHTDRFAAAITGGTVSDLTSEYGASDFGGIGMMQEMGAEAYDDPELYRELSPLTHAANVSTPILILHGQNDDRCPLGQAEQLFTTLLRMGKETEMVVYPGGSHLFRLTGPPSQQIDYVNRVVDWLARHVPEAKPKLD